MNEATASVGGEGEPVTIASIVEVFESLPPRIVVSAHVPAGEAYEVTDPETGLRSLLVAPDLMERYEQGK